MHYELCIKTVVIVWQSGWYQEVKAIILHCKSYAITREEGVLKNGFWVMLLWYSNILNGRNFGVFEGKMAVGDFYHKEMTVKYDIHIQKTPPILMVNGIGGEVIIPLN